MAASEVQSKKRKGATDSQPKAKKARKSDDIATLKQATDSLSDNEVPVAVEITKSKKSKKSKVSEPVNAEATDAPAVSELSEKPKKKSKKSKKEDVSVAEEEVAEEIIADAEEQKPKKEKKSKKSKAAEEPIPEPTADVTPAPAEEKKKKGKKSKKQEEEPAAEVEDVSIVENGGEDADEALDDQTEALLAGFESDRDESDLEKEDEDFDEEALPKMGEEISKKKRKELEKARKDSQPGVIYLGRIPHGFFEPQMKKYFSQFGTVLRLRLSRNKKTGASKHYAFVEFANGEVADIVAKTMHNYLMFGHILQCRVVPSEQVHSELFKGANERFKVDPRNQKEGAAMARGATRDVWEKRVKKENKRRAAKSKALLEEFGYEFNAPAVKSVDAVPKKTATLENGTSQQLLTNGEHDVVPEADTVAAAEEPTEKESKKSKSKKRKSDVLPEATEEPEAAAPKSKKGKKQAQSSDDAVVEKKRKTSQTGTGAAKKTKKAKA